jgi:hypothetical protein
VPCQFDPRLSHDGIGGQDLRLLIFLLFKTRRGAGAHSFVPPKKKLS